MRILVRLTLTLITAVLLAGSFQWGAPSPAQAQIFIDRPDLAVRVRPADDGCALGQRCRFVFTVINRGNGRFAAPVTIRTDARPRRLSLIRAGGPNWTCNPAGGQLACRHRNASLAPGERSRFTVDAYVPPSIRRPRLRVCAEVDWRRAGAMKARNRVVQQILNAEGYDVGRPDGIVGPATRSAIARLQADEGLPVTGELDRFFLRELLDGWGIGDARARNDRMCIGVRLFDTGDYAAPPRQEIPDADQSAGDTTPAPGIRLRCPRNRVQQGRTCVCRRGLTENNAGECIATERPRPRPEPLPEADREVETAPLPKRTNQPCGSGRYRNSSGQCVCLPGLYERSGRCVKQAEPEKSKPAKKKPAACEGGKVRNKRGRCACPDGLKDIDGLCQIPQVGSDNDEPKAKPKPKQLQSPKTSGEPGNFCKDNMILNEKGKCQCYLNLKNRDGKCLVKVRKKCLPGEIINVRGKCECPKDREIRDGKCVLKE